MGDGDPEQTPRKRLNFDSASDSLCESDAPLGMTRMGRMRSFATLRMTRMRRLNGRLDGGCGVEDVEEGGFCRPSGTWS